VSEHLSVPLPLVRTSGSKKLMSRILKSLLLLAGLIAAGNARAQSAANSEGLNPGDQVRILVWGQNAVQPGFSGDFMVAPNGTLVHPLYRDVQVTGIPLAAVEDRVRTFLTRYLTNPQFVVMPLLKVIVSGEVRTPNVLSVPSETTVAQAVVLAGGPTSNANTQHVKLLRDRQEIAVDLSRADSQAASLQIRSGDQILVPTKTNALRDYIGPVTSTIAAVAAIASFFRH
jgi:protein involved in polysaccharide export with SLBB domain